MNVGDLSDDHLHIVIVGPGSGETIAMRVPPGFWVVIDSLTRVHAQSSIAPALELVREYGGDVACAILTHPHRDHAAGFAALVSRARGGVVGCVVSAIEDPARWARLQDLDEQRRNGAVESALSAIQSAWEERPESRWELVSGELRQFGDLTLEPISPSPEALARFKTRMPRDPNRLSAAILATWHGVRLVLGADVVDADWRGIAKVPRSPNLAEHKAMKVAHHGSRADQHACVTDGTPERVWVITPWTGKGGLPRFDAGEGVQHLLNYVDQLYVTAVPGLPGAEPNPIRRARVLAAREKRRFGTLVLESQTEPPFADAWVVTSFSANGDPPVVRVGQRARTVLR